MKIIVTIINGYTNNSCDVQIDNNQRISTTFAVLADEEEGMSELRNCSIVRDYDTGRQYYSNYTYSDLNIYSGRRLIAL